MRVHDAVFAMQKGRVKQNAGQNSEKLTTVWSGEASKDEYPRPQLRRNEWFCLNGSWSYAITKSAERPSRFDGKIQVPFSPECERSGVRRQLLPGEFLWYYRQLEIEKKRSGQRLLLHFGAVDERCIVWWNGRKLGTHENGYLAFSFDVTEQLREGVNTLWVCVQDDTDSGIACRGKQSLHPQGMFYPAQSGIWQTVWLEWVPELHVETLLITPCYDEEAVRIAVSLSAPVDVTLMIQDSETSYYHRVEAEEFAPGETGVMVSMTLPQMHPWSPETPFLYRLSVTAGEDHVESYFAMRKFSVGKDERGIPRLMLNNRPYFFNGVLDQGYWPESLYTPPGDAALIADIRGMKQLGFNMLRKHVKIEPMRYYYHCDRLGMVVWQDMPNGGAGPDLIRVCYLPNLVPAVIDKISDHRYRYFGRSNRKARKQWAGDCLEMVRQLYNCPCIGMWVPFNEGWGQFDACAIERGIKKLDSTRLVDHASGWFDQGGGDIKSIHNYFRRLRVKPERRPVVLTEYGGFGCMVEGHCKTQGAFGYHTYSSPEKLSKAFQNARKELKKLEQKGLSGAVYTQLSDVETEINGLYTYDRKVCKIETKNEEGF